MLEALPTLSALVLVTALLAPFYVLRRWGQVANKSPKHRPRSRGITPCLETARAPGILRREPRGSANHRDSPAADRTVGGSRMAYPQLPPSAADSKSAGTIVHTSWELSS